MTSNLPQPPEHLSTEAAEWWHEVHRDYGLEPHHLRLLQSACESWDRMQQVRRALADHGGLTFIDERGVIRSHPCEPVRQEHLGRQSATMAAQRA
jgi:phage terminase small subunit